LDELLAFRRSLMLTFAFGSGFSWCACPFIREAEELKRQTIGQVTGQVVVRVRQPRKAVEISGTDSD
jgi:hypothetical protein